MLAREQKLCSDEKKEEKEEGEKEEKWDQWDSKKKEELKRKEMGEKLFIRDLIA